jgi:hypothetical protein
MNLFVNFSVAATVLALEPQKCDRTCESYCTYYYPSETCFTTCGCPPVQSLYTPVTLIATDEEPRTPLNNVNTFDPCTTCNTTCNLKCQTEYNDKKEACVGLCYH